ncbi:MAG: chromosome segregation protein [Clostridia bacterium]|nr:chromosome segregation protein [Clostridia bacterium]
MLLKGLEVRGFKSFVDRVRLEFGPGITCIIGPNGSGKSNIADAILWVLGEQSAKALRSAHMDEVIFAGSAGRHPVGLAEVTLILDNTRGTFPLEYGEIALTRRVFRSGEGEYLVNRVPCRLKDIQELLLEAGSSRSALTIVGQGKLEDILTARGEERRMLLEEVLGLARLRWRKKEAEQKLDAVEQDLLRLGDVLNELDRQLQPLAREAQLARRYQKLEKGLALIDLLLANGKIQELKEEQQIKQKLVGALQQKLDELQARSRELAEERERVEAELAVLAQSRKQKEEELDRFRKELEAVRARMNIISERREFFQLKKGELLQEKERLLEERLFLEQEKPILIEQKEKLDRESRVLEEKMAREQKLREELAQKREATAGTVEKLRSDLYDVLHNLASVKSNLVRLEERQKARQKEFLAAGSERDRLEAAREKLERQLNLAREEAEKAEAVLKQLAEEKIDLEEELASVRSSLVEVERQIKTLSARHQQLLGQLSWLNQLEADYAGFGEGVKIILEGVKAGNPELKGVIGVLAEHLEVPEGMEKAVEAALGGALTYILVQGAADAGRAVAFLKQRRGRATFLPLEWLEGRTWPKSLSWCLQEKGVLGIASQLVRVKGELKPALDYLLGQTLVVEDMERAIAIARHLRSPLRLVTLDGDLVQPKGPISGGARRGRGGMLSRRQEITRLEAEAARLAEEIQQLQLTGEGYNRILTGKQKRLLAIEKQQAELRGRLKAALASLSELNEEKARQEAELAALNAEAAVAQSGSDELEETLGEYGVKLKALQDEERQLQEELAAARREMLNLEQALQESNRRLEEYHAKAVNLAGSREKVEAELKAAEQHRQKTEAYLNEVESGLAKLSGEMEELLKEERLLQDTLINLEKIYNNLEKALQASRQQEVRLNELKRQIGRQENIRNQETLNAVNQLKGEEIALARLEAAITNLIQEIETNYGPNWQKELARPRPLTMKKAPLARKKLEAKLLALGNVNLAALKEYERLKARFDELAGQKADLEAGKAALRAVIRECEGLMATRIKAGFQEVRSHFISLFQELFGGGTADLILKGENILEAGIEILASPPGKKLQHLSLLSGGEKALTAIAFIFALLKFRPSPFCIFDEVDTALDEANVNRFARLLKKFTSTTQFIVISHRQGTMAVADTLYGVTMEEAGVSRLVSVKLE